MAKKERCEICDRNFKNKEGLEMHNKAKHSENLKKSEVKKTSLIKKYRGYIIFLAITGLLIWLVFFGISSIEVLPPTDMQGHVEQSPASHVLKEPMPIAIQKHMLEHADGGSRPGIIINYNCEDYNCESDLIENLESFAEFYPEHVYVAPFKGMDAKIALTKLGRIQVLEEYYENQIHIFISGIVPTNEELGISESGSDNKESLSEELTPKTNVKEFSIIASNWKFEPSEIKVNEGDLVRLKVSSIDVPHGLAIPIYGIDEYLAPGQEVEVEFTADKVGTFPFACSVSCGVGHGGMSGKLVVE